MARIRTIKPEFFTSLTIADLTPEQRLTFIGLWTHVDDEGRCIDDPRLIKAALWPLDDRGARDVEADLKALTASSLITRYTLNRKRYLAVTNWHEHQRINRPTPSTLPDPDDCEILPPPPLSTSSDEDSGSTHAHLSEPSPLERKGKEQGREGKGNESANDDVPANSLERPAAPAAARPRGTMPNPVRIDVEQACNLLADLIAANGSRRPSINQRWRDAARLMLDKDGIPLEDVLGAIRWSQADEFWRSNVMSIPKLRDKYDTLRLQAQRGRANGHLAATGTDGTPMSTADRRVADAAALAARLAAEETP
ncbi:hypothetical protein ACIQGZ_17455 [Streptomyces sp. NPDC092296]|uniref:hypothetical protein n=1 Tax=Streptomyces sp. NPDC092296 TaxID=3366012 RepID=UPI0037F6A937